LEVVFPHPALCRWERKILMNSPHPTLSQWERDSRNFSSPGGIGYKKSGSDAAFLVYILF